MANVQRPDDVSPFFCCCLQFQTRGCCPKCSEFAVYVKSGQETWRVSYFRGKFSCYLILFSWPPCSIFLSSLRFPRVRIQRNTHLAHTHTQTHSCKHKKIHTHAHRFTHTRTHACVSVSMMCMYACVVRLCLCVVCACVWRGVCVLSYACQHK